MYTNSFYECFPSDYKLIYNIGHAALIIRLMSAHQTDRMPAKRGISK